jgi:hypothetical protein
VGILARLGIRSLEQATPATPAAGQRALYAKSTGWYDLNSAGVESPIGGEPISTSYLAPTGASYETFPRNGYSNTTVAPASGTLYLSAIALPAGFSVGRIAFANTTAATSTTHWWFGLYDSARVQLATTADQTTTAWATNTVKSVPIATIASGPATTYTTTYTGLYYLGFLMTATGAPSLACTILASGVGATAPVLCGSTSTGLTTPPAFPFTAAAPTSGTNLVYAFVGP